MFGGGGGYLIQPIDDNPHMRVAHPNKMQGVLVKSPQYLTRMSPTLRKREHMGHSGCVSKKLTFEI